MRHAVEFEMYVNNIDLLIIPVKKYISGLILNSIFIQFWAHGIGRVLLHLCPLFNG